MTSLQRCFNQQGWLKQQLKLVLVVVSLFSLLPANVAQAAELAILFNDFANVTSLTLNGDATQVGNVLRLTPASNNRRGSAYLTTPIRINSFQSRFQFYFHSSLEYPSDGLTFIIQSAGVNALGYGGGGRGFEGISPSVAVSFSLFPCGEKVGIGINGGQGGSCNDNTVTPSFSLYGSPVTVWVDYDAPSTTLQVFIAQDSNKPATPLLTHMINIRATVGAAAFIGFTAGTGGYNMAQDILNWTFTLEMLPPVAVPTQLPPANANGWNNSDVTVQWNWEDNAGLGLNLDACTASNKSSGQGLLTLNATCSDLIGNQGSATYAVKVDKLNPTAAPTQFPAANANGWNNSNVTVTWNWADSGSGLDPTTCPATTIVSTEGRTNLDLTCYDLAGNLVRATYTVNLDKTAPAATPSQSPLATADGWTNHDVNVNWQWTDASGGIDALRTAPSNAVSSEGRTDLQVTCRDRAGNEGRVNYRVELDKTAPTVNPRQLPAANADGWVNHDVQVDWRWADSGGSGLDPTTCPPTTAVTTEGRTDLHLTCLDRAGNEVRGDYRVQLDKTAPTANPRQSPLANGNGWNNTDVTVDWRWADSGGSGLDPAACPLTVTSSGEGNIRLRGDCLDLADNRAQPEITVKVDKTAPGVTVTGVSNGMTYTLGSVLVAGNLPLIPGPAWPRQPPSASPVAMPLAWVVSPPPVAAPPTTRVTVQRRSASVIP